VDYRLVAEAVTLVETAGRGVGQGTGCLCQQKSPALGPYFLFQTAQQCPADALSLRLPRSAEPVQVESALGERMRAVAGKPQRPLSVAIDQKIISSVIRLGKLGLQQLVHAGDLGRGKDPRIGCYG
jgi:hypothetical protein